MLSSIESSFDTPIGTTPYYLIELSQDSYGFGFSIDGGMDLKSELFVQGIAKGVKNFVLIDYPSVLV